MFASGSSPVPGKSSFFPTGPSLPLRIFFSWIIWLSRRTSSSVIFALSARWQLPSECALFRHHCRVTEKILDLFCSFCTVLLLPEAPTSIFFTIRRSSPRLSPDLHQLFPLYRTHLIQCCCSDPYRLSDDVCYVLFVGNIRTALHHVWKRSHQRNIDRPVQVIGFFQFSKICDVLLRDGSSS